MLKIIFNFEMVTKKLFCFLYWTYKSEGNTFLNNDTFILIFIFLFIFLAT